MGLSKNTANAVLSYLPLYEDMSLKTHKTLIHSTISCEALQR